MNQPIPSVSRQDVERVLRRDFDPASFDKLLRLLDDYGPEPRVHLAILKLAEGTEEGVIQWLEEARIDFRDVLTPAEFPEYPVLSLSRVSESKLEGIIASDWKQYSDWLYRL